MTLEKFLSTLTEVKKQRLEYLGFTPEEFVDAYNEHQTDYNEENPSVYCGTYGKYNGGSLYGQWIDLTTFGGDYKDFITYCCALHCDEDDPELMFQDYEYFPSEWYDECLSEDDFDKIIEYTDLCEDFDKEVVDAYISLTGDIDADNLRDKYCGKWDSEEDFAQHIVTECYNLGDIPSLIANNIDYESIARELFMCDYDFEDGYVFRQY